MKKRTISSFFLSLALLMGMARPLVWADETTSQASDEAALVQQIEEMVTQLQEKRSALANLNDSIEDLQAKNQELTVQIDNLASVIDSRKAQAYARLEELQVGDETTNILNLLLSSEGIGDFLNRLFVIMQLQDAANDKIHVATQSVSDLKDMRSEKDKNIADLQVQQSQLTQQLNVVLSNRDNLERMLEEHKEAARIVMERQAQALAAQQAQEAQVLATANRQSASATSQANSASSNQASQPAETSRQVAQETRQTTSQATPVQPVETTSAAQNQVVEEPRNTTSDKLYDLVTFKRMGSISHNGNRFTYYSELVLPGGGLNIPGRHVSADGYVVDGDGYIVLANDSPIGTVVPTPFGAYGKVYDRGTYGNHYDVYVR